MKLSLSQKFIIFYVVLATLTVIFIGTVGHGIVYQNELAALETRLYERDCRLADSYGNMLLGDEESVSSASSQLAVFEDTLGASVMFLGSDGSLIYPEASEAEKRLSFDPTSADSHHGFTGDFSGWFTEDMISVYTPIVNGFSTRGYMLLHYPERNLQASVNSSLNVVYLTSLFIFVLTLLLLLFISRFVLKPLRQITRAAKEYAAGNLTYEYEYPSEDELGVLSKTLNFMAKSLAQSGEDQRKFITNVSHDFRSPLTSIKGYIEAILDGTIPESLQNKYLCIVRDETDRLNKLTTSILDINSMSQNGQLLEYSDFDVHHIIKKILATFEGRCNTKRITFELTFSSRELYVHADESRIQQVLYNLVDNAIKFSNPGSVIFIETYEKREKAYISVKDQGVGIPADSLKKIWERFYKTDTSRGRDKKGLGLGLSIVKEIIQAHGENIDVISTEGVGTEFIFTLPLSR